MVPSEKRKRQTFDEVVGFVARKDLILQAMQIMQQISIDLKIGNDSHEYIREQNKERDLILENVLEEVQKWEQLWLPKSHAGCQARSETCCEVCCGHPKPCLIVSKTTKHTISSKHKQKTIDKHKYISY